MPHTTRDHNGHPLHIGDTVMRVQNTYNGMVPGDNAIIIDITRSGSLHFATFGGAHDTASFTYLRSAAGAPSPRGFAIGDTVRIIANTNSSCNEVGDIGTVTSRYEGGAHTVDVPGRATWSNWTNVEDMEHADPSDIPRHRKERRFHREVIVRIVHSSYHAPKGTIGLKGKVIRVRSNDRYEVQLARGAGRWSGYEFTYHRRDLRKVAVPVTESAEGTTS